MFLSYQQNHTKAKSYYKIHNNYFYLIPVSIHPAALLGVISEFVYVFKHKRIKFCDVTTVITVEMFFNLNQLTAIATKSIRQPMQ